MSISTLNENMNIVQSLVIPGIDTDMDIIQKLDDEPNDVGGLTAQELKEEFDKAGNIVKDYINDTLLPAISDTVAEEEQRAQAEAQRQANELARQQAEEQRANETSGIVAQATAQAQQAQQSASAAAQSANSAAQNAAQTGSDAASAAQNASKTASDRKAIQSAIDNIPPGSVPVINNLTTGGAAAALSAEQGKLLGSLSNLTNPQAALANLGAGVKPNLLDNAYFVGGGTGWGVFPVNQRGLTAYSGEGTTAIDRWTMYDSAAVSIGANGLTVSGTLVQLVQSTVFSVLAGKPVTISAVLSDGSYGTATGVIAAVGSDTYISANIGDGQLAIVSFNSVSSYQLARLSNLTGLVAAKVENGPNQTLYYVGNDGKAVLLPQNSDYGLELLKCQQYLQLYRTQSLRPAYAADCRPVMRIDPTPGIIVIDGVTYYTNSAEL